MALKPVLCCALVLCSQEQVGREEAFRQRSVRVEVLLADSQLAKYRRGSMYIRRPFVAHSCLGPLCLGPGRLRSVYAENGSRPSARNGTFLGRASIMMPQNLGARRRLNCRLNLSGHQPRGRHWEPPGKRRPLGWACGTGADSGHMPVGRSPGPDAAHH